MNYGDLGKRFLAVFIDGLIVSAVQLLFVSTLGYAGLVITAMLSWLYTVLMEGGKWHATLGKKIMALYVVDENGNGITYSTSVLRAIGKLLSGMTLGIGYLLGIFSERKQCLHDMIAKTYVVSGDAAQAYANNGYANRSPNVNYGAYKLAPEIVGISGPLAGMVYNVGEGGLVIGRDSVSCQVVLPPTQGKVSRTHCYVTYNAVSGMFVINDRNSTHGTFLADGRRINYSQPAALRSGDRFYLATPDNTFEVR